MEKYFIILFVLASISASILYKKYPGDTKRGIIARVCWFIICTTLSFFFLSKNLTPSQNLVLGVFIGAGLVYYFYKFRAIKQNSGHS